MAGCTLRNAKVKVESGESRVEREMAQAKGGLTQRAQRGRGIKGEKNGIGGGNVARFKDYSYICSRLSRNGDPITKKCPIWMRKI